jgi:hypothetical protein
MKPAKSSAIRLFGAPEPAKFTATPDGKVLTQSGRLHFKAKESAKLNKLLALEKLALDIFENSDAARAFALNPKEYMRRAGLGDVKLDLHSPEVRVAMAVGDPKAREAARKGDVEGFVDAVLAQGIAPSVGLGNFVHTESLVHSSSVVYFMSAVITWQKVVTETAVPVAVIVGPDPVTIIIDGAVVTVGGIVEAATRRNMNVLMQIARHIGDKEFTKKVANKNTLQMVAKYSELVRKNAGK